MVKDEDDDKISRPLIIGINASLTREGTTARNLKKTLQFVEKHGGKAKIIHLVDLEIFPPRGGYSKDGKENQPPYVNADTEFLFDELLAADGFILAVSVHWRLPASPAVAFLEKLDVLENKGCLLEGKAVGILVNYELEEGGVGATLMADFSDMGLHAAPYAKVACNFISSRVNQCPPLEWLLQNLSEVFRKEVDGFSWRLEALANNMMKEIKMLRHSGLGSKGSWR